MRSALILGVALVTSLEVQLCSKKCEHWEIAENIFTMLFAIEVTKKIQFQELLKFFIDFVSNFCFWKRFF